MVKPSEAYISSLKKHLLGVWNETHAHWRTLDSVLDGSLNPWPSGVDLPIVRLSTASSLIDHAVNHKMPSKPIIHRWGKNKTPSQERKADLVEPWLVGLLEEASRHEPVLSVVQAKRHICTYGYTVVEGPLVDALAMALLDEVEPERGGAEDETQYKRKVKRWKLKRSRVNPIRIRAPHPQTVLMHPQQKQPKEAIRVVKMYRGDIAALLERKKHEGVPVSESFSFDPQSDDYFEEVETTEHFSDEWHTLLDESEILYQEPNETGFLPFAHAFSGWGMEPTDRATLSPKRLAVGLLDPILDGLKLQRQRIAAMHNGLVEALLYQYGYAGTMKPEEAAAQLAQGKLLLGKKDEWWVKEVPTLANWLFQVGQEEDADIENGTFSKVLSGRIPGVDTVGQDAMIRSAAERKFDAPSKQLDHLFSIVCSNALCLVEILDTKLTIRDTTVGPDDIQGNYAVDCTFELEDPVMRAQERNLAMQEYKDGLIDDQTYYRDTGRENGTEIRKNVFVEKALKSEQVMGAIIELAAGEFKKKHEPKGGLVGPNGMPIQSQPPNGQTAMAAMPPGMSPAVDAQMQPAETAYNGNIEGVTDAFANVT